MKFIVDLHRMLDCIHRLIRFNQNGFTVRVAVVKSTKFTYFRSSEILNAIFSARSVLIFGSIKWETSDLLNRQLSINFFQSLPQLRTEDPTFLLVCYFCFHDLKLRSDNVTATGGNPSG